MSVSYENSKPVFQGIKAAGITSLSACRRHGSGSSCSRPSGTPTSR